jgi:glycogen synthase
LVPSYFEGLPLNVLEAMTRGCVPVMSDISNITTICFKNNVEGIACKIGDKYSFANAIASIYKGTLDWQVLSINARKKADTAFSSKRMFKEYQDLAISGSETIHGKRLAIKVNMVDLIPLNILNAYIKIKKYLKNKLHGNSY